MLEEAFLYVIYMLHYLFFIRPTMRPPIETVPPPSVSPPEPPKPVNANRPAGHSWYHRGLDRRQAEAKIRKYQKVS